MARDESDREDLLREATGLVERIELLPRAAMPHAIGIAGAADSLAAREGPTGNIVVGFRAGGAASVYFGADPVYHFNTAGELRRAYCDGLLFKAERGQLVAMRRVRLPLEVQLQRHALSPNELTAFIDLMQQRLRKLAADLGAGNVQIVGQVPLTADILGRVQAWLAEHAAARIAARPNVVSAGSNCDA